MPEKFEPIKVVKKKGKELMDFKVDFSNKTLGKAAKDNFRLSRIFERTKPALMKKLDTYKKMAKSEHLDWQFDKVEKYNNSLKLMAKMFNDIYKEAINDVNSIKDKYPELFDTIGEDVTTQLDKVHVKFGPKLEARFKGATNVKIAALIKGVKAKMGIGEKVGGGTIAAIKKRRSRQRRVGGF